MKINRRSVLSSLTGYSKRSRSLSPPAEINVQQLDLLEVCFLYSGTQSQRDIKRHNMDKPELSLYEDMKGQGWDCGGVWDALKLQRKLQG